MLGITPQNDTYRNDYYQAKIKLRASMATGKPGKKLFKDLIKRASQPVPKEPEQPRQP